MDIFILCTFGLVIGIEFQSLRSIKQCIRLNDITSEHVQFVSKELVHLLGIINVLNNRILELEAKNI